MCSISFYFSEIALIYLEGWLAACFINLYYYIFLFFFLYLLRLALQHLAVTALSMLQTR